MNSGRSAKISVQFDFVRGLLEMAIYPELLWLRPRVIQMRALLRHAKDGRVEAALRELITQAEDRLEALEQQARTEKNDYRSKKPELSQRS
jgi:hypothetical protein